VKCIALLSGGLDSCLAVKVMEAQGIEVEAFNIQTPFCQEGSKGSSCGDARSVAAKMRFNLRVIHVGQEYLDMVAKPRHGWGRNMNPCIDCRILMLNKVKAYMEDVGAKFVVTGEVLGQRPMSQYLEAMRVVERESGLEGLLLRPLSARLLPPTIPEIKGWVDRDRLLAIEGRSRKPQFALARQYGIQEPPTPASGCLLTDPAYSDRLRDVLRHTGGLTVHLSQVIKYGRFFRLAPDAFVVVGRSEDDNVHLESLWKDGEWRFKPSNTVGPTALGIGELDRPRREAVAAIVARYADAPPSGAPVEVEVRRSRDAVPERLMAAPAEPGAVGAARI
jgi:tRNA-specific 2-thiouridylase